MITDSAVLASLSGRFPCNHPDPKPRLAPFPTRKDYLMQQHINFITLGVADLAASRRFYREVFG